MSLHSISRASCHAPKTPPHAPYISNWTSKGLVSPWEIAAILVQRDHPWLSVVRVFEHAAMHDKNTCYSFFAGDIGEPENDREFLEGLLECMNKCMDVFFCDRSFDATTHAQVRTTMSSRVCTLTRCFCIGNCRNCCQFVEAVLPCTPHHEQQSRCGTTNARHAG